MIERVSFRKLSSLILPIMSYLAFHLSSGLTSLKGHFPSFLFLLGTGAPQPLSVPPSEQPTTLGQCTHAHRHTHVHTYCAVLISSVLALKHSVQLRYEGNKTAYYNAEWGILPVSE